MTAVRLIVTAPRDDADRLSGELWALGTLGIEERSGPSRGSQPMVVLLAGFADEGAAREAAEMVGGHIEPVDDDAALDTWRRWASPVAAGDFWVVPEWIDSPTPPGMTRIQLEPGRSFGIGSHITTVMALEMLSTIEIGGARVLDMGTGTGVLAIACAARRARSVVAIDCERDAVEVARQNAQRNGFASKIDVAVGSTPPASAGFDLVVANLLLADIEPIAGALAGSVCPGGLLVTTGHMSNQRSRVQAALGLPEVRHTERDGWSIAVYEARG
ncbi:MAG: 50S ribosomal protein L11 methyltransferase [Acidimicrobiales bacterium]